MRKLATLFLSSIVLVAAVGCGVDNQPAEEAVVVSTDNLETETAEMERALASVPAKPLEKVPGLVSWALTTDDKAPILVTGHDAAGRSLVAFHVAPTADDGLRITGKTGVLVLDANDVVVSDSLGTDNLAILEAAFDDTSTMLAQDEAVEDTVDDGLDETERGLSRRQALKCARSGVKAVAACSTIATVASAKTVARVAIRTIDNLSRVRGRLTKRALANALGRAVAGEGCVCDIVRVACDCFRDQRACRVPFC